MSARALAAGLALVVVSALGGCSSRVPAPAPQAAGAHVPAVLPVQVHRVLGAVDHALDAGDDASDPKALASRVDGAALQLRQSAYTVRAAVPTSPEPTALGGKLLVSGVPTAGEWPRWFVAVTRATADSVPQLLVLTQAGPRDPYRLSASATLLPGTTLPALAKEGGTATAVPADDATDLLAAPADAVAHYADVLTSGTTSQWAATTADDAFRKQVVSEQDAERSGVAQYEDYAVSHTPRQGAVWALRTEDGGALVVGVLDGSRTFTPRGAGIRQALTPDLAALAGRGDATSGLAVSTAEVVALQVPPGGSSDEVRLVAGNRGLVGVQVR